MGFLTKKILLISVFLLLALLSPSVAFAADICIGNTQNMQVKEQGICFYADRPDETPGYDINLGGDCGLGVPCSTLPSCSVMAGNLLKDSAYHGIKDDSTACPIAFGGTVKCCAPDNVPSPSPAPCNFDATGGCASVSTGVGTIQVDPASIVGNIFGIVLGISGGLAIILIMISGYQIMFSQGDPEKLKAARERLTSAIIGLLFIIFSVVILRVIGVDILHIPGLNP